MNKELLKADIESVLFDKYEVTADKAQPYQLHEALSSAIMKQIAPVWKDSRKAHLATRRACYFSAEFLVGRAIYNNLLCLGIEDDARDVLSSLGAKLSDLEEIEDAALGNGGLGRLAACFLDSAATLSLPLDGYGIRYKYGLFKQSIVDGFQKEEADDWTKYGDPWSRRNENDKVTISFADQTVVAVPYDMPIIGYGTKNIGTLRLWQAEPVNTFDFLKFNAQDYVNASIEQIKAEDISRVLYPNDDTREGKILRFKQQYFFSAASLADIVKKHKSSGYDIEKLYEKVTIQLNDTHPVISIPELIRILVDNEGLSFEKALEIAKKTFNYTNHTVMAEAMEKWGIDIVKEVLPRIYEIILQINEAFVAEMYANDMPKGKTDYMKMISGGVVHMAKMAVYCSSYTNGVAALHTEILKNDVLKDWYLLFPEKFQNKTNGITPRRWIALCNKELSSLITEQLGDNSWVTDLSKLKTLERLRGDNNMMQRFMDIKQEKKNQLAVYMKSKDGIEVDANSIFDIQIKRLHEYKRQQMNALYIIYKYFDIKAGNIPKTPVTVIFGAKAAPAYTIAKDIIHLILTLSKVIEADKDVSPYLKVVLVQNYNVTLAEKLIPACDISEQISLASKEASGTGNMKFMLNGAVTLGTMDGANVEIAELVGKDNIYTFGATSDEVIAHYEKCDYNAKKLYETDALIKKCVDFIISDAMLQAGDSHSLNRLYNEIVGKDWFMALLDLRSYIETKEKALTDYDDRYAWAEKMLVNIANAGFFSSDRTIKQYNEDIWHL